ncbi:uncharacterized protein LOC142350517 [Convolutriloba macropyga]|uniref:uncharacterized protein LOC142350517 n=1 Tax=Convolutriloba macropyga TaxID=536237 RepID=UPI003F520976
MLITVKPDGSQCPCEIYDQSPTGQIVIGDVDTHPLTPGDEYFVTIRTSGFFGLQSMATYIVKSLPVGSITWNSWLDGTVARFQAEVDGGVGSSITYTIKDDGVSPKTIEQGTIMPFSHHVQFDVPSAVVGTCTRLIMNFHSRGSKPHRTYQSRRVTPPPLAPMTSGTSKITWVLFDNPVLDIWNEPVGGSCPCTLDPIGLLSHEVTGLVAGQDYTFSMQLTSAYGKKGLVTSFKVATYTDVIENSTSVGTEDLFLSVTIESGTGASIKFRITGQLGGIDRSYFHDFGLINQYHFGDLDPGDYYTVEMWVTSLGDDVTALVRSYTFYDHTYPIEPTISTAVTVAEHTMHFGWTNPVYFEKIYIWHEPIGGSCPCYKDNQSPSDETVSDLIAGEEYTTHMLAESEFGRNSSELTFVHSLYTDTVTLDNTLTTHSLTTDVDFDSGVGSTVELKLQCLDFTLTWRQLKAFSLSLSYVFDDIIPGSSYSWQVVAKSRGSNPLQRSYSYSGFTPPTVPVTIITAAGTLDSYDTFLFTVGNQPLADRSTTTLQFTWAQERRIEKYIIKDTVMNRQWTHVIATDGWVLEDTTALTAGMKYIYEITSVSHNLLSSDVMTTEDSLYPLPPSEDPDYRVVDSSELTLTVEYFGFVQYLIVTIEPENGNCALGCKLDAPSTTTVHLTGLSSGQTYTVYLSTESYGRRSDVISLDEIMNMGDITAFQTISSSNMVTIEFQIETGAVGTEIKLDYSAVKTGHTNSSTFRFRVFNRLVLNDLMPSDSYRMNLTLVGKGSPPKTKNEAFRRGFVSFCCGSHQYPRIKDPAEN